MPRIVSVGTAVPPHVFHQDEAKLFAQRHFRPLLDTETDDLLAIFDHAQIETRHLCVPTNWYETEKSFLEKNNFYIDWALKLSAEASRVCLDRARVSSQQITHVLFVSTTGLATPSIDARLIGFLGMRPTTRRTPIWGLGCAGGVAGVTHAHEIALGDPKSLILVVAVELCSLTFHFGDFSKSNFIATALFGDGAAAVLVAGDQVDLDGLDIQGIGSYIWPDSLSVMGWNFMNEGMQVVFSKVIPEIVKRESRKNIDDFLKSFGKNLEDIKFLVAHPGGVKVIEAYEEALALKDGTMALSREILRKFGNMSSASVLFVLDRFYTSGQFKKESHGLMTALGPGFSAEHLLFKV